MRGLSDAYRGAAEAIDAANSADPTSVVVRGVEQPLALAHGRLAAEWIERLVPDADEAVLLAARAHHLRRWEVGRSSYPEGRWGYLRWRRDQKDRHARDVEAILTSAGYGPDAVGPVQSLLRREHVSTDPRAQAVEDAACLVFIETQLDDMIGRLDHARLIEVVRKTARKMSPAALDAVGELTLSDAAKALLADALSPDDPPESTAR